MSNILEIIVCIAMALLAITGIWKANKVGVTMLWLLVGFLFYGLGELETSYKAVVIMLNSR